MTILRSCATCVAAALTLFTATALRAGEITSFTWFSGVASVALTGAAPPVSPNNDNQVGTSPNVLFVTQKDYFAIGPVDLEFEVRDTGGVTEYLLMEGVLNNTGLDWGAYHIELGFGIGAGFVASPPGDGLDFDTPDLDSDLFFNPLPGFFPDVTATEDDILATGGVMPDFSFAGNFLFHIDVPDGITSFTIRQSPIAVPEPSTALLLAAGLAGLAWRRRASYASTTPFPRVGRNPGRWNGAWQLSGGLCIMRRLAFLLPFFYANTVFAVPILTNGSLSGPIANSAVPPGWSITSFSPDTMDENNNLGVTGLGDFGATPSPSPDGGTWVGIFMVGTTVEKFAQSVSGFAIGQSYEISWYHSNFGHAFSTSDVAIEVFVDGASIGTGPSIALGTSWFSESLTFVATASTHLLEFGSVGSVQSYTGIDGIAVTAVPEPSAFALLSMGLVGIGASQRRRRKSPRAPREEGPKRRPPGTFATPGG